MEVCRPSVKLKPPRRESSQVPRIARRRQQKYWERQLRDCLFWAERTKGKKCGARNKDGWRPHKTLEWMEVAPYSSTSAERLRSFSEYSSLLWQFLYLSTCLSFRCTQCHRTRLDAARTIYAALSPS